MSDQEEIQNLEQRLALHRRTLASYLKQQAQYGGQFLPPAITNGIYEARQNIWHLKRSLRSLNVQVADHFDDDEIALSLPDPVPTAPRPLPPIVPVPTQSDPTPVGQSSRPLSGATRRYRLPPLLLTAIIVSGIAVFGIWQFLRANEDSPSSTAVTSVIAPTQPEPSSSPEPTLTVVDVLDLPPSHFTGNINIAGSNVMVELMEKIREKFKGEGYGGEIGIEGITTEGGFQRLCVAADTDIATASRPISANARQECTSSGREVVEFLIGHDVDGELYLYIPASIIKSKPQVAAFISYVLKHGNQVMAGPTNWSYQPATDAELLRARQTLIDRLK